MSTELSNSNPPPEAESLSPVPQEQEDSPMSEEFAEVEAPPARRRYSRRAILRAGIGVGAVGALAWLVFPVIPGAATLVQV